LETPFGKLRAGRILQVTQLLTLDFGKWRERVRE
jgi:hypothetical protein